MKNSKVFDAIEFAVKAHRGQFRKGTEIPYIIHPIRVGKILIENNCDEDIVVAGLLHDTVEDTPVTLDDIKKAFGEKVAEIVKGVSEPDKSDTWENRKKHTIEVSKYASEDVLLVEIADKLDNITSMKESVDRLGDNFWKRFRRGKDMQSCYYHSLAEVFSERFTEEPGIHLAREFVSIVEQVFEKHKSMTF